MIANRSPRGTRHPEVPWDYEIGTETQRFDSSTGQQVNALCSTALYNMSAAPLHLMIGPGKKS